LWGLFTETHNEGNIFLILILEASLTTCKNYFFMGGRGALPKIFNFRKYTFKTK
jgi:hypothetical protein